MPCNATFRLLWDQEISVSNPPHFVSTNILLIGPAEHLDSLTEFDVAKLRIRAEEILRNYRLLLFRLADDKEFRHDSVVAPFNEALGAPVISDVCFLELSVGEWMYQPEKDESKSCG